MKRKTEFEFEVVIRYMMYLSGGKLIFDEVDVTLRSEYILITDGGILQVGDIGRISD